MEKIGKFRGNYACFSNMYECEIMFENMKFRTLEHAFVAAKTTVLSERRQVQQIEEPGDTKRFGRTLTLRSDWEDIKLDIMLDLLRQKFRKPFFKEKLLATGDAQIEEGNTWHDRFWGICHCDIHRGVGSNWLGQLIVKVRDEIRAEESNSSLDLLITTQIAKKVDADITLQVTFSRSNLKSFYSKNYDEQQDVFWVPALAPDKDLFEWSHRSEYCPMKDWPEYRRRFRKLIESDPRRMATLDRVVQRLREGKRVAIKCLCSEERYCHRSVLREMIEERLAIVA